MRRYTTRRARGANEAANPYWISFTDLMTALLAVFILAVVGLVLQLTRAESSLAEQETALQEERDRAAEERAGFTAQVEALGAAESIRSQAVHEIADVLHAEGIAVSVSDDASVLSIPTALLGFDSTSYEIHPEFEPAALAIGRAISDTLRTQERYRILDTVFVEGHTDNRPYQGPNSMDNWGLSAFRAISLWKLWERDLPAEQQLAVLQRDDGSPLFSISGYGDTRPATATQETDEERAANRRIEVRFTVARPSSEDLAEVLDPDTESPATAPEDTP